MDFSAWSPWGASRRQAGSDKQIFLCSLPRGSGPSQTQGLRGRTSGFLSPGLSSASFPAAANRQLQRRLPPEMLFCRVPWPCHPSGLQVGRGPAQTARMCQRRPWQSWELSLRGHLSFLPLRSLDLGTVPVRTSCHAVRVPRPMVRHRWTLQ